MSADPKAAYDDLSIRTITIVGIVGAILVFVAIVAVQVIYYRFEKAQYSSKVLGTSLASAGELAKQRERLDQAGDGADPEKGEKSIPISDAMAAVVKEYAARQKAGGDGKPTAENAASGEAKRDGKG